LLTAWARKPVIESEQWSRGRPIIEKGVAGLLRQYRIVSKAVGPKDQRAKGYQKVESAVHREPGEREKIDNFSSDINAVNGWTGKNRETSPCPDFSTDPADDGIPDSLLRCSHCGRGDGVERWDLNGRAVWLHVHELVALITTYKQRSR